MATLIITLEEVDEATARALANVRLKYLGLIQGLAIVLVAFGIASLGIGFAAVMMTSPVYPLPFSSACGVAQGLFSLIFAFVSMWIVSEGKKTPDHPYARTTARLRCIVLLLHLVGTLTMIALFIGLAMSGIAAVAECKGVLTDESPANCVPNRQVNLALGAVIIVLSLLSMVAFFIIWGIVMFNNRAFGSEPNPNNENQVRRLRLSDMGAETAELAETERHQVTYDAAIVGFKDVRRDQDSSKTSEQFSYQVQYNVNNPVKPDRERSSDREHLLESAEPLGASTGAIG